MTKLTKENSNIEGLQTLELKKDNKTEIYKKIETKIIIEKSKLISIIGILTILNIINHLTIIFPRLTFLLLSILFCLYSCFSIGLKINELYNKISVLNLYNKEIIELYLVKKDLFINIKDNNKNKNRLYKFKNFYFIHKVNQESFEINLLNNTVVIPHKIKEEIKINLKNSLNDTKKIILKEFFKKSIIFFILFEIALFLIIRNIKFFLLMNYPIVLVLLFLEICIISNKLKSHKLEEIENILEKNILSYKNKKFYFVINNEINSINLETYKEEINQKENKLEIDPYLKTIYIPKKES